MSDVPNSNGLWNLMWSTQVKKGSDNIAHCVMGLGISSQGLTSWVRILWNLSMVYSLWYALSRNALISKSKDFHDNFQDYLESKFVKGMKSTYAIIVGIATYKTYKQVNKVKRADYIWQGFWTRQVVWYSFMDLFKTYDQR